MILRRIRGAVGTMLTWTFGWSVAGAIYALVLDVWARIAHPLTPGAPLLVMLPSSMIFFGIYGALAGAIFAALLAVGERGQRLVDLSTRRVTRWGALAGAALPIVGIVVAVLAGAPIPADALSTVISGASLGSLVALGTLAVARRAESTTVEA